jgi:ABC-type Fe3+ transport system substrate-binding protein
VSVISRPPHPNARKVFVSWLLSREGQTAVIEQTRENSRRLDVPVMEADQVPPAEGELLNTQAEDFAPIRTRANEVAKELFK